MKRTFVFCSLVMMGSLLGGCAKKGIEEEGQAALTPPVQIAQPAERAEAGSSDITEPSANGKRSAAAEALQTIYFAFDSYLLSEESRKALVNNARWLKDNQGVRITIAGHADERGSDEYNLALGEKRATMVKRYLTELGIAPERLSTISYGEEKPAVQGKDESAWSKNRRAEFL
jgi:peptidoglycan-associated lipoprotein